MSKKDETNPTEGKDTKPDAENGEKTTKELGIVRHIHELLTTKDGEVKKPEDDPEAGKKDKEENPEKNPDDDKDDKENKDDKSGEGGNLDDVQGKIDKTAEAIAQAEKDKKEFEEKIGKLEKRLKGYEKKEETEMVDDIKGVIADLKKSAEDKGKIAKELKKIEDELTQTKEKLGERDTQLGKIAMDAFEAEKKELIEAVKKDLGEDKAKEVAEKITNPKQLEDVKGWLTVFVKAFKKEGDETGESKDNEGGESLGEGADSIPLKMPSRQQAFERGRDVINALYDAYEVELFKKETGRDFDVGKLTQLEAKVNKLWGSVLLGIAKRGGKVMGTAGEFDVRTCQYCHKVFMGDKASCPYCEKTVQSHERGKANIRGR